MSENPYIPPAATLSQPSDAIAGGSLHTAIDGRYSLPIERIWSHAWKSTKGAKLPFVFAMLVFFAVSFLLSEALAFLNLDGQPYLQRGEYLQGYLLMLASGVLMSPVTVPMTAGIFMMGARRAAGHDIRFVEMFAYYNRVVPLVLMSITSTVLIYAGFALCLLPGIYLSVGYFLAAPLLVDKNLSPWEALESSRKAIHHSWFTVFLLFIGTAVVATLASIPLVTVLWSVPWLMIVYGTLYVTIFGLGADDREPVADPPAVSYP